MQNKLKPCPFCDGEAEFERLGNHRQSCIVACTMCGARHESSDEGEHCGSSWNHRADIPMKVKQVGWYGPEMPDNTGEMRVFNQRPHSLRHGEWPGCPVYVIIPEVKE